MRWPPRFAFIGGTLAIDFAQTGGEGYRARWEGWHRPEDLADWAELQPDLRIRPSASDVELAEARVLREAIWRVARAHVEDTPRPDADFAYLETVAATPDLAPVWRAGRRQWQENASFSRVLSSVARDALSLFGTERLERLRECANPNCQLMFIDNSRPGRRQWCSMGRCGNLSKVARHRAKTKGEDHDHHEH